MLARIQRPPLTTQRCVQVCAESLAYLVHSDFFYLKSRLSPGATCPRSHSGEDMVGGAPASGVSPQPGPSLEPRSVQRSCPGPLGPAHGEEEAEKIQTRVSRLAERESGVLCSGLSPWGCGGGKGTAMSCAPAVCHVIAPHHPSLVPSYA